jgi:poly-beta-1,6-N-acetyl-D-glucosamine synthase
MSYVIITPVRNEQEHLPKTIASVVAQTVRPLRWIIVNDGSSDRTAAIIDEAARQHPWIRAVHRTDRGFRKQGGGVMEAFYDGLSALNQSLGSTPHHDSRFTIHEPQWDFLVKLDGDLSFRPDYFERCLQHFAAAPRLGIGGGTICNDSEGEWEIEWKGDPPFHVRGATKIYRRQCWEVLGDLVRQPGWDTLDELKANMLGWTTRTFSDAKILHHRKAGEVDGLWKNWVKNGRANYITGYHPLFMLGKCARRAFRRPYLIGALGLLTGFFGGYIRRVPQITDRSLVQYLRTQQMNRLLARQSIWSN